MVITVWVSIEAFGTPWVTACRVPGECQLRCRMCLVEIFAIRLLRSHRGRVTWTPTPVDTVWTARTRSRSCAAEPPRPSVARPIASITSSMARSPFSSSSTSGTRNCPSFASHSASSPTPSRWRLLSVDHPTNITVGHGVATDFPLRPGHPHPTTARERPDRRAQKCVDGDLGGRCILVERLRGMASRSRAARRVHGAAGRVSLGCAPTSVHVCWIPRSRSPDLAFNFTGMFIFPLKAL